MIEREQRRLKALPLSVVTRKAETDVVRPFIENAHEYSETAEMVEQGLGTLVPHQCEQRRAANPVQTRFFQKAIHAPCFVRETQPHRRLPRSIRQGFRCNVQRRAGNRPWAEPRLQPRSDIRVRNCKTKPDSRQAIKFAEGTKDDQSMPINAIRKALGASCFDEGFIHHQQAAVSMH